MTLERLDFAGYVYVSPMGRGITLLGTRSAEFAGAPDLLATAEHVLIGDKTDGYAWARITVERLPAPSPSEESGE